jgi:hypothetical protein
MIAADSRFRGEMALCNGWGMRHSEFLSWPELDQDKAVAYAAYAASVCQGCGTRPEEWEPEHAGDRHAYEASVLTCPGCQVRGDLERELREGDEASGRYVVLIPRVEAERGRAERAARRARRGVGPGA